MELTAVRGFLRHLSVLDGATEVPAPGLLGPAGHRKPRHVYSEPPDQRLLPQAAAGLAPAGLAPAGGLRPHCYATLFGLIACTGLRICEALALTCGGCRPGRRHPDRPGRETRPDPADPAAPQRPAADARLRSRAAVPLRSASRR